MAPTLSKIANQNTAILVSKGALLYWLVFTLKNLKRIRSKNDKGGLVLAEEKKLSKSRTSAALDGVFFARLKALLRVVLPSVVSPEAGFAAAVALLLIARSACDIWMIRNGTLIERVIIGKEPALFWQYLLEYCISMPIISLVNNLLKYSLDQLKVRFRMRLSQYVYSLYLDGFTFYKMNNLDARITNADQLLTTDVEKFCDGLTDVYSNISKPLLDIVIYVVSLSMVHGFKTPAVMTGYLLVAGFVLTRLRRPTARLTVKEQKLEGHFRYVNSRLITHAEEVAFYKGSAWEKRNMFAALRTLAQHSEDFLNFKFIMGFIDNIFGKYGATTVGYLLVSEPFLDANNALDKVSHSERLEVYYKYGRQLVKLAESIGRLVLAMREMTRLAGFTARVTELIDVLKDVQKGRYERTMLAGNKSTGGPLELAEGLTDEDLADDDSKVVPGKSHRAAQDFGFSPNTGKIICRDNIIRFDRVPLVTPNGDVLIETLSFEVKSGMNVLVCGPNGCGKSSLFRVLGELWPLWGGTLIKPSAQDLFYVPQRPYMTVGTLRDQVIYPDSIEDMRRKKITDADLEHYLGLVQLSYILQREGGWDARADWMDVLSGGEKQRVAMSRLFYHKPQFAILDECTSAVSVDVEGSIYQYCRSAGITLFTVSHRQSLWKHHEYYLHMDGRGSYKFSLIDENTTQFGS